MKLTEEDKQLLREIGHSDEDFPQIEEAMQTKSTEYTFQGKRISRAKAIELLGRRKYLCGLSRSAFHWSAVQPVGESDDPEDGVIRFDSHNLFK